MVSLQISVSILFFTFSNMFPCNFSQRIFVCSFTGVDDESLHVDCQKNVSRGAKQIMYQIVICCRPGDLEQLPVDWERGIICYILKFSGTIHTIFLSCTSCICEVNFCVVACLSLNSCLENSSIRISDCSVRGTTHPFTHHLIRHFSYRRGLHGNVWWCCFCCGLWNLNVVVVLIFHKPNSLQRTPCGSITHSTGCGAKTGFPLPCLPEFSFNANSTFFGVALCTATTDQCSATRTAIRRPMRSGSGWRASTGCLSKRCAAGFTSPRVPLEHVNSAGVDSKSAAEKRSFCDTTFHLSPALALLIVLSCRKLPRCSGMT